MSKARCEKYAAKKSLGSRVAGFEQHHLCTLLGKEDYKALNAAPQPKNVPVKFDHSILSMLARRGYGQLLLLEPVITTPEAFPAVTRGACPK